MAWVKVKWIPQLFAAFDQMWPNRTRMQDGTIGDVAHQGSVSGHNPDDTAGSKPERTDADSVPEVRAADVDARGVPMQAVIDGILAVPAERDRFIYIIFNGWQWRAAAGWARTQYLGTDRHTTHAHFSGHPDHDEDSRPFVTITGGSTMATWDTEFLPPEENSPITLNAAVQRLYNAYHHGDMSNGYTANVFPNSLPAVIRRLEGRVVAMASVVESLAAAITAGGGNVDTAVILAAMDDKLEELAAEQRDAVADLGEGGAAQVRADA